MGIVVKGIGDESLGGQFRTVQVAAGQARSANEQLARDADWHGPELAIENIELSIGDRPANDDWLAGRDLPRGRPDRGLGGTVEVPELRAEREQAFGQVSGQCFSAAQHLELWVAAPARPEQHPPSGGSGLHDRGATHPRAAEPVVVHRLPPRGWRSPRTRRSSAEETAPAPRCQRPAW